MDYIHEARTWDAARVRKWWLGLWDLLEPLEELLILEILHILDLREPRELGELGGDWKIIQNMIYIMQTPYSGSRECHGISNHQQLNCLFKNLSSLTTKEISKLCIGSLCDGNTSVTGGFPSQRASNVESFFLSRCYKAQHLLCKYSPCCHKMDNFPRNLAIDTP